MEFKILGSLEVVERGRSIELSGQKQRVLLAMLLLHANEVVSSDRLVEALWGGQPPDTAPTALQVHVSQLRKLLDANRIETRAPGYRLRVAPEELDLARFEELVAANGDERPLRLQEALALWRGSALSDFAYDAFAQADIARLEELRLGALEEQIDSRLARGRHSELVSELEALVHEHPFREKPRVYLMIALYRCGRQAEALARYHEARRLFVDELGIEPGVELQRLERQILNQDPELAAPPVEPEPTVSTGPREERKVVTVLFCDLVGFTARAEELDPEDVGALVLPFYVRLRAELERHGGTVEKFIGDAVMALFGAPVTHEDDPDRAVRAALAIRDWITEQSDELEVRIGIGTGEALVRLGAQPAEGEPMAVGDVVNTAARLQQAAPRGTVVVGEATYRATRDAIVYEQLDPVAVKGKSEPVPLWMAKRVHSHVPAERETPTPFLGREDELSLLRQAYERTLHEGSLQLVTIVGEPGIGKTRLVGELRAFVEQQEHDVVWRQGRCLSYGEGITFWALGQIVKAHAGILESDSSDEASAKLAAAIDEVADQADRRWLVTRLAPLVGAARGDHDIQQTEAFAAWRTFLEGIAAQRPLVLVIEDLHWADSALLAFLDNLVDQSVDVPMLVLATARPELYERAPNWGGGKRNTTTASLGPLSEDETTRLIAALLAQATLPPDTQAALLARAEGNPLYAEEFVRMLMDRGLLARRDGTLELASDADIPVPESVHAVIAARLDTLVPDRKSLVHDAAVVGKVFWAGALSAMSRVPKESVLAGLHELVRKELIRRVRNSSIADDVEYVFWHVLVRDVAYAQIPRTTRASKHVAAAEWIERIAGERVTDHAEFLASHYATALELLQGAKDGRAEKIADSAVRFTMLAAERAIRLDHTQGERYYRRALALLDDDDPRRPRILADAADAGTMAGVRFEQIKEELENAIATLLEQGQVIAAARAMRQLSFALYGTRESLPLAQKARRLLEGEPPGRELGLVYARLAQEELIAGRMREALSWSEKALPLLAGLGDEDLRTRAQNLSARCALGDQSALEELRALAKAAVDPAKGYATHPITITLNNLAADEMWFGGGPQAAADALITAADLAGRRGLERPSRWYRGNLAEAFYDLGKWDDVLRIRAEIEAWEELHGQSAIGTFAPSWAARILAARGRPDEAAALVEAQLPRAKAAEGVALMPPILVAAAIADHARNARASAVGRLEELAGLPLEDSAFIGYLPAAARVSMSLGEVEPIKQLLGDETKHDPRYERFVTAASAFLSEAGDNYEGAESLYKRSTESWDEYGCVVERAYALMGLGRCRLALGRSVEARNPLNEARTIFGELDARVHVLEIDNLLAKTL